MAGNLRNVPAAEGQLRPPRISGPRRTRQRLLVARGGHPYHNGNVGPRMAYSAEAIPCPGAPPAPPQEYAAPGNQRAALPTDMSSCPRTSPAGPHPPLSLLKSDSRAPPDLSPALVPERADMAGILQPPQTSTCQRNSHLIGGGHQAGPNIANGRTPCRRTVNLNFRGLRLSWPREVCTRAPCCEDHPYQAGSTCGQPPKNPPPRVIGGAQRRIKKP